MSFPPDSSSEASQFNIPDRPSYHPAPLQLNPLMKPKTPVKDVPTGAMSIEETYQEEEDIFDDDENKQDENSSFWILRERKLRLGSSTWTMAMPEPEQHFEQLQGRLPFGRKENTKQFLVTKQEMNRRVNGPQRLNSSSVACFLRRSKVKNCGGQMRAQLQEAGVHCEMNSQQQVEPTKVIALCESEALHLARDLNIICEKRYPAEELGREVMEESQRALDATSTAVNNHGQDLVDCLDALGSVLNSVIPPISGIEPIASEDSDLNLRMEELSCITHGLGVTSSIIWHKQLSEIAKSMSTKDN